MFFKSTRSIAAVMAAAVMAVTALVPTAAYADIFIEFSDGSTVNDNFEIQVGTPTQIQIFLTETSPNTDLSVDGLVGFGLSGDYAATEGSAAVVTSLSVNPDFDLVIQDDFTTDSIEVAAAVLFNPIVTGSSILLGSFEVTASGLGTTEFTFIDQNPDPFSDFASGTGTDLDPTIFAGARSFSVSLTAVPEPSSIAVLAIPAWIISYRRRRVG